MQQCYLLGELSPKKIKVVRKKIAVNFCLVQTSKADFDTDPQIQILKIGIAHPEIRRGICEPTERQILLTF